MTTLPAGQRAAVRLPAPPARRGTPAHPDRRPASVLDLLCPPCSPLPSALDVDPARLAPVPTPHREQPAPVPRVIGPAVDDDADRRTERLRALAFTAGLAALVAVSAGALRLAL